jgi:hypothetical protein
VDEEDALESGGDGADPFDEFALVGVAAEVVEDEDSGIEVEHFAEDADLRLVVNELAAEGVGGLIAGDDDEVARVFDSVAEVMEDAAAFGHSAAGDDDEGAGLGVEGFAFVHGADVGEVLEAEGVAAVFGELRGFAIVLVGVLAIDVGDVERERAVNINGDLRELAFGEEFVEEQNDVLGAADGEGGDDDVSALGDGVRDGFAEAFFRVFNGTMLAVAVGAFDDEVVGGGSRVRIFEDGNVFAAEVAGVEQAQRLGPSGKCNQSGCRSENVSGVVEDEAGPGDDLLLLAVLDFAEERHEFVDVDHGVERRQGRKLRRILRGLDVAAAVAIVVRLFVEKFCVGLLNARAVHEHGGAEVEGGSGGVDGAGESLMGEGGEIAAVVEVRVREDDGAHGVGIVGKFAVVRVGVAEVALLHAAVEQEHALGGFADVRGAGDFSGSAPKTQSECAHEFRLVVALEDDLFALPADFLELVADGGDHVIQSADVSVDGEAVSGGDARVGLIGDDARAFSDDRNDWSGLFFLELRAMLENFGDMVLDVAGESGPSVVGAAEGGEVVEVRVLGGGFFEVVAVVDFGFVAGSVNEPDAGVLGQERRGVFGEEPLHEAAHGRDSGAGGDEDCIHERLAEGEESVGAVELDAVAFGQVGEEVGKESAFDAVGADVEDVAAGRGGDGVGAGLLLAVGIGRDHGDELAGFEGEVVGAFNDKLEMKCLGLLGEQDLTAQACCEEFSFHLSL